ncbi:MAG: UvrD-helicase domain-containing protein [Azoarcus sp.]|jgi:DNA helicase-2/ATP-dependent DNA helicase PcrA|nr:UvrD-helicase domain-containing protein [Azoarcus sp.]
MSNLLDHLNTPQIEAVTLPAEHALILAGAGSGKTRVLTTRIAWLIQNGLVGPAAILAVTFTNKTANEMKTRLEAMLMVNTRAMWIGTFHGLCNRMLRAHHHDAGLPRLFQILDSGDQLAAIKRLSKALNIDDGKFPARDLQLFINVNKEAGRRPHTIDAYDDYTRRRIEIYQEYEAQCQRESVVDFAELLLRSYELLERHEPIRRHYQSRFRHILVDEFQDTNVLQYRWLKLLASGGEAGGAALFCVGDDDQSIYRFRGAEIGNMRDFEREFHVRHLIRLEQNYRSHGNILDAANAIIRNNGKRLGKNLWTESGAGEPIRVFEACSDTDEARWIVEEIQNLIAEGAARSDIALLYRSNAQSRALEHQLFAAGIAYRVHGGLRFFERQEIKHALAYLRLIANPDDDTAFARVVNFPTRGIGARSQENLQDAARARNSSLHAAIPYLAGKAGIALAQFARLIEDMRRDTVTLPLSELVRHVVDKSGLAAFYQSEKDGAERLENLNELETAAKNFEIEERSAGDEALNHAGLAEFLTHAALEAGDHQAGQGEEAVQLMTVHAAKGLEFQIVFISGLEEDLFPHGNSVMEAEGLEEERRLMYVAVTRARERLYLSSAQTRMLHGQTNYHMRSRFVEEIPEELVKWLGSQTGAGYGMGYGKSSGGAAIYGSVAASARTLSNGLRIGQCVAHPRFGQGVIIAAEGSGEDAKVQINFANAGVKWLVLAMAKLETV